MHLWLVSIFEQTPVDKVFSTRFLSIANEALKRGHHITFFASTFKHNTKNQRFNETHLEQINEKYKLVFIKSKSYKSNISVKRLKAHYDFASVALSEMQKYPKPDVILMAYPPITLCEKVSSWAKKNNIPVAMDIIDPWPDSFKIAAPKKLQPLVTPFILPMQWRLIRTLKSIDLLTAISRKYIDWANDYFDGIPKTKVFYPAADYNTIKNQVNAHRDNRVSGALNIVYAGSLALSYDLDCILKAAMLLEKDYPDIHFYIAGAGQQAERIQKYANEHNNLSFLGRLSKDELMKVYANSHLGCTQHIKGATQSVTYKLFDLLSAGLPILNSLESEMKDIIVANQVGLHNEPGNADQLAKNILLFYHDRIKLNNYKQNGYALTEALGNAEVVYERFVSELENLTV
jgi:glycosyltransferase involved in cell wall biosynthesis